MKSMRYFFKKLVFAFLFLGSLSLAGQVKYDEGAMYISGVTLLQDRANEKDYYYLPQFPRLSTKEDGSFEFLCLKYVGDKAENSGGLFHALALPFPSIAAASLRA